MVMKKCDKT